MANDTPGRATFSLPLTTDSAGDAADSTQSMDGNYLDLVIIESSDLAATAELTITDLATGAVLVTKTTPVTGVFAVRYPKSGNDLATLSGQSTAFRVDRGLEVKVATGGDAKKIALHFRHQQNHPDG